MIITRKAIPRRTFLRGMNVALALPLLDAMVPAIGKAADLAAKPAARFSAVYVANGVAIDKWVPKGIGANFELSPTLEALRPYRDQLVVLSGLNQFEGRGLPGEGGGDHARASTTFLTGAHPTQTEGADLHAGISMDQIAAKELGKYTELASLELSLDKVETLGACETGYSCAYMNTLAWRSPTQPIPMVNQPRAVFENLFGDSGSTDAKERLAQIRRNRSILDFANGEVKSLLKQLGSGDTNKVNEYLDAIRDVERRIQRAEEQTARAQKLPVIERPASGIPDTYDAHAKLMFDLQVLAFQTDMTRVTTFMMEQEQTARPYPEIGIADAHHALSHHGGDLSKIAKLFEIDKFHVNLFAYYLERLKNTPDGDGSLLDHSVILYGSGLSDGNMHRHDDLPLVLAGGACGKLKGGRHVRYPAETEMPLLYGTLLRMLDVPVDGLTEKQGKSKPLAV
jgi:hypothetical protein